LEGAWVVEEKVVDQLSDDEIAQQWEYNVEDPHTPRLVEPKLTDLDASEEK
jgi:GTP-binding protein